MKPISFILTAKPYPFEIFISFNQSQHQFENEIKRLGLEDFSDPEFYNSNCKGRTVSLESGATIVRFKDFRKDAFHFGLINHEVFHMVEFIFKRIGMPHSVKYSSEAYAYLIQDLTEQILTNIGFK